MFVFQKHSRKAFVIQDSVLNSIEKLGICTILLILIVLFTIWQINGTKVRILEKIESFKQSH